MEILYLCEVELRSLADLKDIEKLGIVRILCKNLPDECFYIKDMKFFVKMVVDNEDLTELKKYFCIRNAKEAVCHQGILYTKF